MDGLLERASRFFIGHRPPCVYLMCSNARDQISQAFPLSDLELSMPEVTVETMHMLVACSYIQ